MSDCVKEIVDRRLVIDIREGDLCKNMSAYDADGDGVLEASDLLNFPDAIPTESAEQALHGFVVTAFRNHGIIDASQEGSLLNYFDLYNRFRDLDDVIIGGSGAGGKPWIESYTNTWGSELEFEAGYWNSSVFPLLKDDGLFSNSYGLGLYAGFLLKPSDISLRGLGYQLSMALYNVLDGFKAIDKYKYSGGCSGGNAHNQVDIRKIPAILRSSSREMIAIYNRIEAFLDEYEEIECEGKGCPDEDEFKLHNLVGLEVIESETSK